jgi:Ca2+-transporting ATPase
MAAIASQPKPPTSDEAKTEVEWYRLMPPEVADRLHADLAQGLSSADVQQRLQQYGPNALAETKKEPAWRVFLRQFEDYMQLLLIVAAALSVITSNWPTAILLVVLVLFNAILSYNQEGKAEARVAALKKMLQIQATVRRDGKVISIPANQLVPGDVALLQAGDMVPADGRLLQAATLEIDESALTGESQPVAKGLQTVTDPKASLGDQTDMAFMNTLVTRGSGEMVVTATGMATQVGKIATLLQQEGQEKSPLEKQIDRLTVWLSYVAIAAMAVVIIVGLIHGQSRTQLFNLAIVMAIAAVPTGMPTVLTTLLSLGMQELAKAKAIVKRLGAVDTLGSVSAIFTDKTGTLTLNKMTATVLVYGGNHYSVTGVGYSTLGQIQRTAGTGDVPLEPVLLPMVLNSDASLHDEELVGDPTEGALVVLAAKGGLDPESTRQKYPRLAVVPFDAAYKYMATFHNMTDDEGKPVVRCFVKGAPDVIFGLSRDLYWEKQLIPMNQALERAQQLNQQISAQGMRGMALAVCDIDPKDFDPQGDLQRYVKDLTLLGFVGIVDPPRPEDKPAIATAHTAGIRVRMLTGDYTVTGAAIAKDLGIEGRAISGNDLDALNDEQLAAQLDSIGVVGRVAPRHKVRMVKAAKATGLISAMTGDGVNDAPSLKAADIGIAMGITGTEVSKQAAGMILSDDNFATIVKAVEMGRGIYDNLMKYLRFQLMSLLSFVVLFVGSSIFNIMGGIPLTPLQVLWVNFAIAVPLAIALGLDIATPGLMARPPRKSDEQIMDLRKAIQYTIIGVVAAGGSILAAVWALQGWNNINSSGNLVHARTVVLTTFSLAAIFSAIATRFDPDTIFRRDMLAGRKFWQMTALAAGLTLVVTGIPFLQRIFDTTPLSAREWGIGIVCALATPLMIEIIKVFERRSAKVRPSVVVRAVATPVATLPAA